MTVNAVRRATPQDECRGLADFARPALVVAGIVLVVQLAFATRYGWHRDELYFLAASRHLAWGYVDQPPFTPVVARVATAVFGTSLVGLRLAPALANAAVVILAAFIARELGGRRRAQILAATAVAVSSVILATGHLLSTTTFDLLAWAALTAVFARLLRTGDTRWWVAVGLIAGVGLENKYTVAFLVGAFVVGVVLCRRDLLRGPWLWVGGAIALVLWAPNLVWQSQHGWPAVEMSRSLHAKGVDDANTFTFLPLQLIFVNPVVTPLWIAGLLWTVRTDEGRVYRAVAVAWVVLTAFFMATAGKAYYIAGLYPFLLAAGSVWLVARWRPAAARRYLGVVIVAGAVATPLALPILPITAVGSGAVAAVNPEFRESYAWPQFAHTVERVPGAMVFTLNYGEAGAIQRFVGGGRPVYSAHNNYWLWGPPPDGLEPVVVVGHFSDAYLAQHFRDCRPETTIDNPSHVPNQEQGAGVWSCSGPLRPWHVEWPSLRHYS